MLRVTLQNRTEVAPLIPFMQCYDLFMKKESAPNRIESVSKIYEYGKENLEGYEYLDRFEGLTLKQEARLDGLIGKLSELYSKRNGQWLSNFLKEEESNEWNRDYETGNFTYIEDLRKSEVHNVHDFARWYDYAMLRYSREYFLPAANRHDETYINAVQKLVSDGVLPESTTQKMSRFAEHKITYRVVDVFRERDNAGFNAGAPYSLERKTLDALLQEGDEKISPETIFLLCGNENINNIRAKVFSEFQKVYPEIETELDLVDRILERFNWISYQDKLKKEAE